MSQNWAFATVRELSAQLDVFYNGIIHSSRNGLRQAGLHFRNQMEVGPGGKQIQLQDPDGNPIELFEPAQ